MASPDVQILAKGGLAAPLPYTLAPGAELLLLAAFATFDGTGAAGAFLPCLTIRSATGDIVSRTVANSVAAGASSDVTFAPFLRTAAAAAAAGTSYAVRVGLVNDQVCPNGSATQVSWDEANYDTSPGSTMWSAGTPKLLVAPVAGAYLVTAYTTFASGTNVAAQAYLIAAGKTAAQTFHTPVAAGFNVGHMLSSVVQLAQADTVYLSINIAALRAAITLQAEYGAGDYNVAATMTKVG